jgi:hypothetical protein
MCSAREHRRFLLVAAVAAGIAALAAPARSALAGTPTGSVRFEAGFGPGFENGYLTASVWQGQWLIDFGLDGGLIGVGLHGAARVRVAGERHRLLVGAGLALTLHPWDSAFEDSMLWLTADVAYQGRIAGGWFFWASAGATRLLNPPPEDADSSWIEGKYPALPIATLGVGAAF